MLRPMRSTWALLALIGCTPGTPGVDSSGPGPGPGGLRTQAVTLTPCTGGLPGSATCPIIEVPLDNLGEGGIAGAKIVFVVQTVGSGLYLNNLRLVPGAAGALIEHPTFVSVPTTPGATPILDPLDRFADVVMNLMANVTIDKQQILGGAAAFVDFPLTNKLEIRFGGAKPFDPNRPSDPGPVGCQALPLFVQHARAQMKTNCGNCHAGQQIGATVTMDLTEIDAANAAAVCQQVLRLVFLSNIPQSGIFIAPAPGNASHPFRFGSQAALTAFMDALNPWIIAERDAPAP